MKRPGIDSRLSWGIRRETCSGPAYVEQYMASLIMNVRSLDRIAPEYIVLLYDCTMSNWWVLGKYCVSLLIPSQFSSTPIFLPNFPPIFTIFTILLSRPRRNGSSSFSLSAHRNTLPPISCVHNSRPESNSLTHRHLTGLGG